MPAQKPGRSRQDYATPLEFLWAVKHRLGIQHFSIDLAATPSNAVAKRFYTVEDDALVQSWVYPGWAWLNPPFANIKPWAQRAYLQSRYGAHIAMLVPAAVGANWWKAWVHHKAFWLALNGRITFVGETAPYPKDCALLLYGPDVAPGHDVWTWTKGK